MKKILLTVVLVMMAVSASAQWKHTRAQFYGLDTIVPPERIPTYYYWDTVWYDKYLTSRPDVTWQNFPWSTTNSVKPEYARYCYTDTSLRVIGIAAALNIYEWRKEGDTSDIWKGTVPDYFRLYEVDTANDDLVMLASKSWHGQQPKYLCQAYFHANPAELIYGSDFNPIFEVYFDSAITVHDSFYVSATSYNYYDGHSKPFYKSCIMAAIGYKRGLRAGLCPNPQHFRRKILIVDTSGGINNDDSYMCLYVFDTNWHTSAHVWKDHEALGPEHCLFPYIFPIIDTSHYFVDTVCDRPTGFGVMSITSQSAMLSWDGGGASNWELAVGPEGCIPETATSTFWDQQVATLTGLEQGQWYYAWVRAVCDTARASQWSERLRFYIPADGTQEDITDLTATDRHTHIMPNPASTSVTVISAFRISVVEVWSLNGKLAMRHEADGMTTAIDISTLPKGTYMLRIGTNHGYTHKKLVVE